MAVLLVLASASPARLRILRRAGVSPQVEVSDVDETAIEAEARAASGPWRLGPADVSLILARAKCEDVASRMDVSPEHQATLVLGCDSVLEFQDRWYGKPGTPEEAAQRWLTMSGNSGTLHTGHWLIEVRDPDHGGRGASLGAVGSTRIHFASLSEEEIGQYVITGEPLDVAGAFTIDGLGGPFIDHIEGDPHNVIGLSLPLLRRLVQRVGLPWVCLWRAT